ncbi:uncharacterized protein LOC119370859 [Jatropha curcas]|uniref:uncharacterized protein LOC119370859 n=1 Tax=Jatropha curcas TaxID=180498 RepID=UPI001895695B|nr:uncharacterized protein LOC119370859 [Jatropha curcas]
MGEVCSAMIQRKRLPPKCKDRGMFAIPYKIGNVGIKRSMCDLGASINVIPLSVYSSFKGCPLKETRIIIQLADRSIVYPVGLLEDVLVQVGDLIFPANFSSRFYYLIWRMIKSSTVSDYCLGDLFLRNCLRTARTKIDAYEGTLSMEFDGEKVEFNVYEAMKNINMDSIKEIEESFLVNESVQEIVCEMETNQPLMSSRSHIVLLSHHEKLLPSVLQAPKLELKPLPDHLKYAFLGNGDTLPVIISSKLSEVEEESLVQILLEEGSKPTKEAQRRLNPPMMEVVKKEILKLLDAGMIYPISDSKWVSPVQVVPKKTGITVVENAEGELLPTRVQNGWRMFLSNTSGTRRPREDDFHLPFWYMCLSTDVVRSLQRTSHIPKVYGFYRRFIKDFSKIAQPLCKLLQKDVSFVFDEECRKAFDMLKEKLISAPIVQPPNWNYPFEIMCDASNYAVGAVLGQRIEKNPHVIYYASRTLDNAQCNYSTTQRKRAFWRLVLCFGKVQVVLLGTKVIVFSAPCSIELDWILLLQEFDIEIRDKKGSENLVADHLSRLILNEKSSPLDDDFPDEQLFSFQKVVPWYANIVNYLVAGTLPENLTRAAKDKIKRDAKYFVWDDPYLWKFCSDQVIRRCVMDVGRCVMDVEVPSILKILPFIKLVEVILVLNEQLARFLGVWTFSGHHV